MKKWIVSAEITISVHTEVEARNEEHAKELASDRPLQAFCHQCAGSEDVDVEWRTSGELDGELANFRAEPG